MWVPRVTVARRCGAKLLTAHRGGGIELSFQHTIACVDVISHPYVSRKLCRLLGVLWIEYGTAALEWEKALEKPVRASDLDPVLEKALTGSG